MIVNVFLMLHELFVQLHAITSFKQKGKVFGINLFLFNRAFTNLNLFALNNWSVDFS